MTFVLALGTGMALDEAAAQRAHAAFLGVVGRMRACIDPNPAERVRDVVTLGGRRVVLAADPKGRAQAVAPAEAEAILADAARYGHVSLSHGVAESLGLLDGLGLPVDPALAERLGLVARGDGGFRLRVPGGAFDGALVTWNGELRDVVHVPSDADWLAEEGLGREDVRAVNAAVHDLFEFAWSHALVVRVGRVTPA